MRFGSVRSGVGTEDERNAVGALAVLIGVDGSTANRRSTSARLCHVPGGITTDVGVVFSGHSAPGRLVRGGPVVR